MPNSYRLVASEWQTSTSYRAIDDFISYPTFVRYILALRYIVLSVFLATAGVIVWRRWHDWMVLLTSATLVVLPTTFLYLGEVRNLALPPSWFQILDFIQGLITTIAIVCMVLFVHLFPDGKFFPRWIMFLVVPLLIIAALLFAITNADFIDEWVWYLLVFVIIFIVVISVPAQVYRYRSIASASARQQIKWVIYAISLLAGGFLLIAITGWIGETYSSSQAVLGLVSVHINVIFLAFIPASIGISILRYRLWDIDIIIRKTLVYGALSLTLAVIYFGSVILLQSLVSAVGGQQSVVVTVISTLIIAALFTPLRRRIQSDIDRRFYRRKYDAEKIVAAFGAGLREKVDLDDLQIQVLSVVAETLQPETLSLWLRPVRGPGPNPASSRVSGTDVDFNRRPGR
jgi:hypothetical protein